MVTIGIVGLFGSLGVELCAGNIKSKKERRKKR